MVATGKKRKRSLAVSRKSIRPFMCEDCERHWGCFSFKRKLVLDIGADYGSTASYFIKKGAKMVVAVESDPALFRRLQVNFRNNKSVIPVNFEVSCPEHIEQLITRYEPDVVKVDCEGCEVHLTMVNPKVLRKVTEYLVETHEHIGLNTRPIIETLFERLDYVFQTVRVEPNPSKSYKSYSAQIIHAKKAWGSFKVSEPDIVRWKNALSQVESADLLVRKLKSDPLSMLLYLYASRVDLQRAFPEARKGDYRGLIEWANDVIRKRTDEHDSLSPFAGWYSKNVITSEPELKPGRETLAKERSSLSEQVRIDWSGALSTLMKVYKAREDLRTAFPEAARGDEKNLVQWAARIVLGEDHDGDVSTLTPYGAFYASVANQNELKEVRNELSLRTEKINGLKNELAIRIEGLNGLRNHLETKTQEIIDLRNALMQRTQELDDVRKQLSLKSEEILGLKREIGIRSDEVNRLKEELSLKSEESSKVGTELVDSQANLEAASLENDNLRVKLTNTQSELKELKQSFGYQLMKFYGSKIDRVFPVDTRRRELKKIMSRSARIAADEGIRSLFLHIGHKLQRRELRINEPFPHLEVEQQTIAVRTSPEVLPPSSPVLLHCDYPRFSPDEPAKVAGSFMLTGWALSEKGIKRIDLYIDNQLLGNASYGISRPDVGEAYPSFPKANNAGFRKLISVESAATKQPRLLKIVALSNDLSSATLQFQIEPTTTVRLERPTAEAFECLPKTLAKASVVILTKSSPDDFEQTLDRLRQQQLANRPEIILVNSGSDNLSDLSRKYGTKVLNIPPEEFSHARTRNYGAAQATGDYIFFLADDAIPASNHLLSDMIGVLENDEKIAAVSARQLPRSDADLMACQAIWGYYNMLGLQRDRVVSSLELTALAPDQKRQLCQIDDVCSCFRKNIFLNYRYREQLSYAEDLDIGTRLVKDGFKIAQLYSVGVIHSHNRSPTYYLKRGYVDTKTLSRLLDYDLTEIKSMLKTGKLPLREIIHQVLESYRALSATVDYIKKTDFQDRNIQSVFQTIASRMKKPVSRTRAEQSSNIDLSDFLAEISNAIEYRLTSERITHNLLTERYLNSLRTLEGWLVSTRRSLESREGEFIEALYKVLGEQIGSFLGEYYVSSLETENVDARLPAVNELLERGI